MAERILIDTGPIVAVLDQRDQDIDLADACLVHLADRESISNVFTVDHRHFQLFRNAAGEPLRLLPGFGERG